MRVLVTGSSGRIGSAIVHALRPAHDVIGLDTVPHATTTHIGSITDEAVVTQLVPQVDAVIHTASLHAPHRGVHSDAEFRDINVSGTERLLDAAVKHRLQAFVYTSTTSVYGAAMQATDRAVWVTELLAPEPRDIYDETKLAAEALCARAHDAGLPTIALRVSRCFPESPRLMAIYRLYRGVDVRDVASAHVLALTARFGKFEIFNIAAHSPFAESDCAELKCDAAAVVSRAFPNAPAAFAARGWALPTAIDRVYVTDKARQQLRFVARYDFASLVD